jgi:Tfp pilus assembly protein PilO
MKNRNSMITLILFGLTILFWLNQDWLIGEKPLELKALEMEQEELNEQLISAQILANKLDQVYTLFDENLALSKQDSIAEDASIPFLKNLTVTMNNLEITLLNVKPQRRVEKGNFLRTPYELIIKCTYSQLGKFMAEIERSPRLIIINEFTVKNGIERVKRSATEEDLLAQIVEIHLATLTLVKSKTKAI